LVIGKFLNLSSRIWALDSAVLAPHPRHFPSSSRRAGAVAESPLPAAAYRKKPLCIVIRGFSKLGGQESRMRAILVALMLTTSACGFRQPDQGSSVTIKLPPPKPAVAPGFSASLSENVR
jgi:hypothetical protein